MMTKRAKQTIPAVPSIECAMDAVQENANRSMLPQVPYANFVPGFGWVLDSVCDGGRFPLNAKHIYEVAVLPRGFFN